MANNVSDEILFADVEEQDENVEIVKIEELEEKLFQEDDESDDNSDNGGYFYNDSTNTVERINSQPNSQSTQSKYQPSNKMALRYTNRITVEKFAGPKVDNHVSNKVIETERRLDNNRKRMKDKSDRATVEQVLDPRTRLVLAKMMNKGTFCEVNGCISTGKEANVYHAVKENGSELAIKVFKTAILVFKNRDKYVQGEHRFRNGLSKNPRRKIETWSEKEMRNLIRMRTQGLNVPKVYEWKSHVLVMDFIGKNSWAAPKLKDVVLSPSEWRRVYRDVVVIMWKLHKKCKLVHADLSEFNMLYYKGEVYVIDVSQAIESNQRNSFTFLRKDIKNVTTFFRKQNVPAMTIIDLFLFIVDPSIDDSNMEECLDKIAKRCSSRDGMNLTPEEEQEENIFMEVTIAKSLSEIYDVEREIEMAKKGLQNKYVYREVLGLNRDLSVNLHPIVNPNNVQPAENVVNVEDLSEESDDSEDSDEESEDSESSDVESDDNERSDDESDDNEGSDEESDHNEGLHNELPMPEISSKDEDGSKFISSARPRHETLEEKKARKKAVKEGKAEKRKTKMKKQEKKSRVKNTKKR